MEIGNCRGNRRNGAWKISPSICVHLRFARPRLCVAAVQTVAGTGASSAKLRRIRKPLAWLFSGWNCVANKLPRQIIEQKGPP
jgi:hypothetical protein